MVNNHFVTPWASKEIYSVINGHMQSKNDVIYWVHISMFEKWNSTFESNRSVDRVKKETAILHFAVTAWTSNFIVYFYNALDVFSPKMELIW